MSERIMIGTATVTGKDNLPYKVKIYLGNIVEMPDGSQQQLPESLYNEVLRKWEDKNAKKEETDEQVKYTADVPINSVPEEPEPENTPDVQCKTESEIASEQVVNIPDEPATEFHIQYLDPKTGTLSYTRPTYSEPAVQGISASPAEPVPENEDIEKTESTATEKLPEEKITKTEEEPRILSTKKSDDASSKPSRLFTSEDVATKKLKKKIKILTGAVVILFCAIVGIVFTAWYFNLLPMDLSMVFGNSIDKNTNDITEQISILQVNQEIPQGTVITEAMLSECLIPQQEYKQLNMTTYIASDGSTKADTLILASDINSVIGKFAAYDIPQGSYISVQDVSNQKVIAEKNYMEVEVDGQTVSVPVDGTTILNDTRVKIVALIDSDTQDGTIAIALGEFVLEDRTLKDIFDSAGQSILDKLASQTGNSSATQEPEE